MSDDDELYPVPWTFKERIPKAEVEAFMQTHPELKALDFEDARAQVAKHYFHENAQILKLKSKAERDVYYAAQYTMQRAIDKEEQGADPHFQYRKRKDEVMGAMQGPLTTHSAKTIEYSARALQEINRLIAIEDKERQEKEFRAFLRNSAQKFNEGDSE